LNKIISFDMKKGQNVRHVMGKVKKKVNLGVLGMNPYVSKGVPKSCLDKYNGQLEQCLHMTRFFLWLHNEPPTWTINKNIINLILNS